MCMSKKNSGWSMECRKHEDVLIKRACIEPNCPDMGPLCKECAL